MRSGASGAELCPLPNCVSRGVVHASLCSLGRSRLLRAPSHVSRTHSFYQSSPIMRTLPFASSHTPTDSRGYQSSESTNGETPVGFHAARGDTGSMEPLRHVRLHLDRSTPVLLPHKPTSEFVAPATRRGGARSRRREGRGSVLTSMVASFGRGVQSARECVTIPSLYCISPQSK